MIGSPAEDQAFYVRAFWGDSSGTTTASRFIHLENSRGKEENFYFHLGTPDVYTPGGGRTRGKKRERERGGGVEEQKEEERRKGRKRTMGRKRERNKGKKSQLLLTGIFLKDTHPWQPSLTGLSTRRSLL